MEVIGIAAATPVLALLGHIWEGDNVINVKNLWRSWLATLEDTMDRNPAELLGIYMRLLSGNATAKVIKRVQNHLLQPGGLAQVDTFRTAYTQSFSMVGVAGAITAQIGITALSLPQVDSTHWTVQASFILALLSGCLCVYYACFMQGILSDLHGTEELLKWLTRPRPLPNARDGDAEAQDRATPVSSRVPSPHAAEMLTTPTHLLTTSLCFLVLGLALYLIFLYAKDIGPIHGKNAAMASMIVYIIFAYYAFSQFFRALVIKRVLCFLEDRETSPKPSGAIKLSPLRVGQHQMLSISAALEEVIRSQEAQIQAQRALLDALRSGAAV